MKGPKSMPIEDAILDNRAEGDAKRSVATDVAAGKFKSAEEAYNEARRLKQAALKAKAATTRPAAATRRS
jgi:hypothetical protein